MAKNALRADVKRVDSVKPPLLAPTPIESAKKKPAPADLLSKEDRMELQLANVKIEKADAQMLALKVQFEHVAAERNALVEELNRLTGDVLKRYQATEADKIDIIKGTITRVPPEKKPAEPEAAPPEPEVPAAKA